MNLTFIKHMTCCNKEIANKETYSIRCSPIYKCYIIFPIHI